MLSRRHLLGATAGLAVTRGWSQDGGARLGSEILPDPDFTKLREKNPYVIGVRPHRKGGVRLELDTKLLESKKIVVHNYGHGGSGITLSFGTASVAADLVEAAVRERKLTPAIAVLGTGAVGLATATELRRRFPKAPLAVYANDVDVRTTTSFIAGGQFEPSGLFHEYEGDEPKKVLANYLRRSRDRILELLKSGAAASLGIVEHRNFTLDHENRALDEFTPFDVVPPHRTGRLPFEKLDVVGREYANWLLNPTILLPKLAADLAASQTVFASRTFSAIEDVTSLKENVVVNCTGYGAKTLFGDADVVPQRGHLVVLQRTDPKQFYFFSGGCANPAIAYAFCRQDDIVLGGSVHSKEDSLEHTKKDDAVFKQIVGNLKGVFAGDVSACKTT